MPLAGIDHRLYRESQPGLKLEAGARSAVMQHLRVFMEYEADAVTAILAYDRAAIGFHIRLDRVTDITEATSRPHGLNTATHSFMGDIGQPPGDDRRLADKEHSTGIAMKPVLDNGDVDIDYVPVLQPAVAGDAVANHVVDGGADRFREALVVQWCRHGIQCTHDVLVADAVELAGRYPSPDVRADHIQHLPGQPAGNPHFVLLCR